MLKEALSYEGKNHGDCSRFLYFGSPDLTRNNTTHEDLVGFSPVNCHHRYRSCINKNLFMAIQESLVKATAY